MSTKSMIESLRSLSLSTQHRDIDKSELYNDAANLIERLDRQVYDLKEEIRRLHRIIDSHGGAKC